MIFITHVAQLWSWISSQLLPVSNIGIWLVFLLVLYPAWNLQSSTDRLGFYAIKIVNGHSVSASQRGSAVQGFFVYRRSACRPSSTPTFASDIAADRCSPYRVHMSHSPGDLSVGRGCDNVRAHLFGLRGVPSGGVARVYGDCYV